MFGFLRRKDEIVGLNQKLGRLLNDYCMTNFQEEKQRTESRTRLALPCAMFLFAEARDPKCYAVGVTSDLSLHGLSLVVNEKMEPVDYVVVLGADDRRLYIKATCQRCIPSAFGTYTLGIEFKKMLSPRDFPALVEAVAMLEAPLSPPPIPLLSQPVNPSPFNLV